MMFTSFSGISSNIHIIQWNFLSYHVHQSVEFALIFTTGIKSDLDNVAFSLACRLSQPYLVHAGQVQCDSLSAPYMLHLLKFHQLFHCLLVTIRHDE